MRNDPLNTTSRVLKYALVASAALYVAAYLVVAAFRLPYPFELEWMEGGAVDHVRRILAGQPLYVEPTLDFVPYIYTPLYFYLSAALASLVGVGFVPLRFVSFAASLGCLAVIFLLVKREAGHPLPGLLAASLFAATYRISGAWLDIARVDSLFLFLLLLGAYLVRFGSSWSSCLLAGMFLSLAFLTKQTALMISLPILFGAVAANWRRGAVLVATAVLGIGGSTLVLNAIHHGWFNYYVFALPGRHQVLARALLTFWTEDLLLRLPLAFPAALVILGSRPASPEARPRLFYLPTAAGMLGGAWFSRLHFGGYDNVLLPAYAILAVLFGLAVHRMLEWSQSRGRPGLTETGICLACLIQFAILLYNPLAQVPTARDRMAGQAFTDAIRQIPGDVFIPYHGYLPALAGKESHAQWMALSDVLRGGGEIGDRLRTEIAAAIGEQRFAAIIVDIPDWFQAELAASYEQAGPLFTDESVFWPVTGPRIRPEIMYLPTSPVPARQ